MATPTPSTARLLACAVVSNEPIAPGLARMRLLCPELARSIRPGQFFSLAVPGDPTQMLRVPLSYAKADPAGGEVEFVVEAVGDATRRLAGLAAGTETTLLGPGGHGWDVPAGASRVLVACVGTAAAPMVALTDALVAGGVAFDYVGAPGRAGALVYADEARAAAGEARFPETGAAAEGDGAAFVARTVCEMLGGRPHGAYDAVYACGPEGMMAEVAAAARAASVACQVSMERLMACGFGACTTCLVDTVDGRKGACMCGPVFDAEKVIW